MDFSLTEEQQAMVDAARRFVQQKLKARLPRTRVRRPHRTRAGAGNGLQIGDGTAQIMKLIIARQMTGGGS